MCPVNLWRPCNSPATSTSIGFPKSDKEMLYATVLPNSCTGSTWSLGLTKPRNKSLIRTSKKQYIVLNVFFRIIYIIARLKLFGGQFPLYPYSEVR